MSVLIIPFSKYRCRTSHEVRGLKYNYPAEDVGLSLVAPHTRCVD